MPPACLTATLQVFYDTFGVPETPLHAWKEAGYFMRRDPFAAAGARCRPLFLGAKCSRCDRDVCAARCARLLHRPAVQRSL